MRSRQSMPLSHTLGEPLKFSRETNPAMQEPEDNVAWAGQVLTLTAFLLFVSISSHSRNAPHDLLLSPSERCHSPDGTHLWQSQFWWEPASKTNPGAPWLLQVDDPQVLVRSVNRIQLQQDVKMPFSCRSF